MAMYCTYVWLSHRVFLVDGLSYGASYRFNYLPLNSRGSIANQGTFSRRIVKSFSSIQSCCAMARKVKGLRTVLAGRPTAEAEMEYRPNEVKLAE